MKNKIEKFKRIRQSVKDLIDQFPENHRLDVLFDQWNLKDIVAHLNNWMVHDIDCLTALKEGREPYWEPDVDEFNRKGIEERKSIIWEKIYKEFIDLGDNLINIYETLPDNLWGKSIWQKYKNQTAHRFLDDDISHWESEHLGDLREKLNNAKTI